MSEASISMEGKVTVCAPQKKHSNSFLLTQTEKNCIHSILVLLQTGKLAERQSYTFRQTDCTTNKQTSRQTDRQAGKLAERQSYTSR